MDVSSLDLGRLRAAFLWAAVGIARHRIPVSRLPNPFSRQIQADFRRGLCLLPMRRQNDRFLDIEADLRSFATARRTIQGFEAMLWLRKGFGFASAWTVREQNQLLAFCFGFQKVNEV